LTTKVSLERKGGEWVLLRERGLPRQGHHQWRASHSCLRETSQDVAAADGVAPQDPSFVSSTAWLGIRLSNPNEMTACLSIGSVPFAVVSLVRKIEQVTIRGGDFYLDFEFVSLGHFREDESPIQRFPVEIAVRHLDGQVVIDTPIKYDKSIPLAGVPRTGSMANLSWAVMRKVYGQEEDTFGKTWDEVRHLLHDAGMKKDSYIVEWSNSGIDYSFLKMIMQQHTPSNSILLIYSWRTVLQGFSSMELS